MMLKKQCRKFLETQETVLIHYKPKGDTMTEAYYVKILIRSRRP